jgi:signal transduction histidine kinase
MSSRKKAQAAFASALLLLFLSGLAGYVAVTRLLRSQGLVIHTQEVQVAIGDVDSALTRAGRSHSGYLSSGSEEFLNQFEVSVSEIPRYLEKLKNLTADNPKEQELCSRLENAIARRIALLRESTELGKKFAQGGQEQADILRRSVPISSEITAITGQMREEENRLLEVREKSAHRIFVATIVTLVVAFLLALELFAIHYRLLSTELAAREQAEQLARESEDSLRRLTGRLLQLQDAERRKFSRELHDSLGQYLVGAKMNLEMFASQRKDNFLVEAIQLLDQSIGETRTISHLLHPPLLDEAGFSSAAKWYVEGFSQRSGIDIKLDLPDDVSRVPKPIALGLFRVLQESLTNIHRHSGSAKAEVVLDLMPDRVVLKIRDYGKGIAPGLLKKFRTQGTNSGVGLAGMTERTRELGGQLAIQADNPGILITASMPLSRGAENVASAAD